MILKNEKGFLSAKLMTILGFILILLIGAGFFAYITFLAPSKDKDAAVQQPINPPPEIEKAANLPGPILDLDTFIVNLSGDLGRRYLKTTIKLELSSELLKKEIDLKMPEIRDNMLVLLSSKSYDDIADISGKIRLRTEIISRINNILTSGEIQKVYFTEFVIQ